ncbi:MAG: 4Fe-4S binding protein [Alloprevotella sp.]
MQTFTSRLLSLTLVFLMLCAAAAWSGSLLGRPLQSTADSPTPADSLPPADVLSRLQLTSERLEKTDSAAWEVFDAEGEAAGYVFASAPYAPDAEGFAGPTPLFIRVDADLRIVASTVGENEETPDFLETAFNGIAPAFQGKTLAEAAAVQPDAVSGATYTSHSLIENYRLTLAARAASAASSQRTPALGWLRTAAVLAVLLVGVLVSFRFRRVRWLVTVLRLLNVGVLGLWCGQFLSLTQLRDWVAHGLDPVVSLAGLVLLLVALLMPFFGKPHHYCHFVCPLGSAQALLAQLPFPKIRVGEKTALFFSRLRLVLFTALMVGLWAGVAADLLEFEPFSAFQFRVAAPAVMILCGVILFTSCFVPRLWCRALCPLGELLTLAEGSRFKKKKN